MNSDSSDRLEDLFVSLLDLDSTGQAAVIEKLEGQDPDLAAQLRTMVQGFKGFEAHVEKLEPAAINKLVMDQTQTLTPDAGESLVPMPIPPRIGGYTILRQIGEGGMGRVFLAEQDVPRRKVALKLVASRLGSTRALQRFRSEYQTQGRMKHPNIAHLIEVGSTERGETFLTMEYLEGKPLTTYCRENALPVRERLLLFRQVCRGVQHAHQRTILHRDLKPSNILVVATRDRPRAKIIDFGLAKDLSGGRDFLELTQQGQVIGTPLYMCPEHLKGQPMDTRGDIYSLGVVLYELLAQRHPLDKQRLKGVSLQEVLKICTLEVPPVPSARVAEAVAAQKASKKELRSIRGDLDWITMKAMAKDIDLRYASLAGLIDDLDRFLDNRPVLARSPSLYYQASMFCKRNKLLLAAAGFTLSVLILGLTIATISAVRLAHAKRETEAVLARYRVSLDFLENTFASPDPNKQGPQALVMDLLASADGRLEEMNDDPELIGTLRTTLGRTYLGLGIYSQAEQQLRQALAARAALLGEGHPDTSRTSYFLALSLKRGGHLQEALQLIDTCIRFQSQDPGARHPDTLRSRAGKAIILSSLANYDAAHSLFREVLVLQSEVLGSDHVETAQTLSGLGNVLYQQRHYAGAEKYYRRALAFQEVELGPLSPITLVTRYNLGHTLFRLGRYCEAETMLAETISLRTSVLGPAHPFTLDTRNLLAYCFYKHKKYEEAEHTLLGLIKEARQMSLDPASEVSLRAQNRLAMVYLKTRRTDQAILQLRALDKLAVANGRQSSPQLILALHNLGHLLKNKKATLVAAQGYYERALDGRIQNLGGEHPDTLKTWFDLAEVYVRQGQDETGFFIGRPWRVTRRTGALGTDETSFGLAYARWLLRANRLGEARDILSVLHQQACAEDTPRLPLIEAALDEVVKGLAKQATNKK